MKVDHGMSTGIELEQVNVSTNTNIFHFYVKSKFHLIEIVIFGMEKLVKDYQKDLYNMQNSVRC